MRALLGAFLTCGRCGHELADHPDGECRRLIAAGGQVFACSCADFESMDEDAS